MITHSKVGIGDKFVYTDQLNEVLLLTVTDIYIDVGIPKIVVEFKDVQDGGVTKHTYGLSSFLDRISDPYISRVATRSSNTYFVAVLCEALKSALFWIEEGDGAFSCTEEAMSYVSKVVREAHSAIARAEGKAQ